MWTDYKTWADMDRLQDMDRSQYMDILQDMYRLQDIDGLQDMDGLQEIDISQEMDLITIQKYDDNTIIRWLYKICLTIFVCIQHKSSKPNIQVTSFRIYIPNSAYKSQTYPYKSQSGHIGLGFNFICI